MNKFKHRSKVGVAVAAILMTIGSVSPVFAANTVDGSPTIFGTNEFSSVANGNVLVNSSTNTFGKSGIISNNNELTNSNSNTINGNTNILNDSNSSIIIGNENILTGSGIITTDITLKNKITGDKNELTNSDTNTINGNTNILINSDSNTIIGNGNKLTGKSNTITTGSNTITGNGNILDDGSYSNTITGNTNNLKNSFSNTITGNGNKLTDTYSSTINGSGITLGNRKNVAVVGNEVVIEANNATALGYKSKVTAENSVAMGANSIADRPNTVSFGSQGNERQLTNVANGTAPTDAVNVRQLGSSGALAAALTGIMPLDYDPNARTQIGVGVGGYHGERAVAIGVNHYINESVLVNAGMSADGSERMYRGGLTWRLGHTSPKMNPVEVENMKSHMQQQESELQLLKKQVAALVAGQNQTTVVAQSPVQKINIQDVLFDFDKDTLQQQAYPILDNVVTNVKNNPNRTYLLVGNTDSKGTKEYNMDLSLRRAQTVQNYLISQGVPANLLSIDKAGELQPKETNSTEEGRAENRRVDILVK